MLADINGNLADLRSEAMASQRFCLRWNNHQSNLLSVFDQLLHDEAFVDVTLAVEGQLLRAHKMVLSACSPYFQALFTNHPDKHPIVILKDVPYVDMRSLLDFMYRGEVSVDQERLPAFLRVAESLRIKGLTEVNEEKCDLPSITSSLLGNQNTVPQPPPNLHRINQIGGGGGGGQHQQQIGQKRFHHMSSHPLLGSALTAPKRKRGRPRKLSGSSDTERGDGTSDLHSSDLVQGSPEMMEMKMGIDFQSETSGGGNGNGNNCNRSANSTPGPIIGRKDDTLENGERDTPEPVTPRIKREPEPTPSTSAQDNLLPGLPSDTTFELCDSSPQELETPSNNSINERRRESTGSLGFINDNNDDLDHGVTGLDGDPDDQLIINNQDDDMTDQSTIDSYIKAERVVRGIHFLTDQDEEDERVEMLVPKTESTTTTTTLDNNEPEIRKQLLEYLIQNDGSVVCKWCGEVLPSRTRWYRHKYKLHVTSQVTQPAPLFKCHTCNAYFKSRKGYIGHLSSRHSDNENDENREEPINKKTRRSSDIGKGPDWEQQREKEEKLVADIIDRVKRECEAQGETVTRRGYSRRSTVVNT